MYNCNYFPTTSTTSSSFQPTSSNNTHPNNSMMDSFSSMMLDDDSITSLSSNNNNNNNLMEDISCIIEYGANLFASSNLPLSPPTVIIPSGSSNNNSRHTTPANNHHHHNNNNNNNSNVIVTPGAGGSVGDFAAHMLFSDDFDQVERVETMLELDTRSVLREWEEFVDNNNNNINNNNNYTINNNINTINNIHHNNSSNNININNNTNNISVNIQPSDEQDAQDLLNLINSNNNTGLITQAYLGSVLANCTSIQGLPSNTIKRSIHQHSKSPSLGSLNNNHTTNGSSSNSSSRGIRKGGHQRSHSVQAACAQAITYTNSMMHKKNGQSVATGFNNMNAGLGSPSVTSSNYSSVAVMSPANVSSNSFANQVMYNNGYNNQSFASAQCSPVLSNQPQVPTGSNKRGKVPLHRQDKSQQANLMNQHSKGLLVDANPNDRPVKMQQSKICDSGIKIQIEDGINKNKKDTGLQFHTCTFK